MAIVFKKLGKIVCLVTEKYYRVFQGAEELMISSEEEIEENLVIVSTKP